MQLTYTFKTAHGRTQINEIFISIAHFVHIKRKSSSVLQSPNFHFWLTPFFGLCFKHIIFMICICFNRMKCVILVKLTSELYSHFRCLLKLFNLLRKLMEKGSSMPWSETLYEATGETRLDGSALREYFRPLEEWLRNENLRTQEYVGWNYGKVLEGS